MDSRIEQILKEGEICRQSFLSNGIQGPIGPQGLPGPTGPTGPGAFNFNDSLYGVVNIAKTVDASANVLFDSIPVSNNITYSNGDITLEESGLYYVNVDAYATTSSGQQVNFEVRRTSPTEETILAISSGTYVNSGSSVDMHGGVLFYGEAGDVINIVNTSQYPVTIETSGQNALNFVIYKIADTGEM